ncbi:MAG: hypothetical protein E7158_03025 [Firmicutes bacterium]|nr:hypothetical protein [Bacillota bacterium]
MSKKKKDEIKIKMLKKYKIPLIILFLLIVICVSLLIAKHYLFDKDRNKPTVYSSILDSMESYGYTLDNQDSKLFKDTYYELKKILDADEIDYDAYSQKLSELFIIDLYTIDTKINRFDVGGVEYLYENEKEMFKNKVMDTLYESLEDNSYGTRKQELPSVKKLILEDSKKVDYKIDDKKLNGIKYTYTIEYEKDLGYDKNIEIIAVKDSEKVFIVEFAPVKK